MTTEPKRRNRKTVARKPKGKDRHFNIYPKAAQALVVIQEAKDFSSASAAVRFALEELEEQVNLVGQGYRIIAVRQAGDQTENLQRPVPMPRTS